MKRMEADGSWESYYPKAKEYVPTIVFWAVFILLCCLAY